MKTNVRVPLGNVMDLLLDAICVVDVHGRFVFVSGRPCTRTRTTTSSSLSTRTRLGVIAPAISIRGEGGTGAAVTTTGACTLGGRAAHPPKISDEAKRRAGACVSRMEGSYVPDLAAI